MTPTEPVPPFEPDHPATPPGVPPPYRDPESLPGPVPEVPPPSDPEEPNIDEPVSPGVQEPELPPPLPTPEIEPPAN